MKLHKLLIICFCLTFNYAFSQENVPFDKKHFPEKKKELKEVIKKIEEGDYYANPAYTPQYDKALKAYDVAYKFNPNNANLNFKMGKCLLHSYERKRSESIEFLEHAYKLNSEVSHEIHFYLGRSYHINSRYEHAIEEYKKYLNAEDIDPKNKKWAKKHIGECEYAMELSKTPIRVFIDNVGGKINSKYRDSGPIITADDSEMMFTSRRPNTVGGGKDNEGLFLEDIYICYNKDGEWTEPQNMGKTINTNDNDATVALSPSGDRMIIYREGDLFESDLVEGEWTSPKALPKTINTKYIETHASFSYDGKKLYFVSDRPDLSMGGKDIFVSELNEKGEWGDPKNLGKTINTEYWEDGIFVHPDGKTIYFNSEGHNSIGGYDIFKSTLQDDGTWSKPKNLGIPVNTPMDDSFLVITASGRHGYFASKREDDGYGDKDIYVITFLGPEKPVVLSSEDKLIATLDKPVMETAIKEEVLVEESSLTVFRGRTFDDKTKKPVGANIEIIDNTTNKVIGNFKSNSKTGKFLLTLPAGRNYGIAVKANDYLFHSENFDVPETNGYQLIEKDVYLKKIEEGSNIVLKNIFFDHDKASLKKESNAELDRLFKLLQENPKLKIEISGHTDSSGSETYNQALSERRAKSVVDYLLKKGVKTDRLKYVGHGEAKPIATNKTKEGRQTNRRTEFKVIGK